GGVAMFRVDRIGGGPRAGGSAFKSRKLRVSAAFAAAIIFTLVAEPFALAAQHHRRAAASAENEEGAVDSSTGLKGPYAQACVIEPVTGTFIFEKNDHQPWPTASLAKMMLMLVVAQKLHDGSLKLTDQITTSREAAKMGGSQVYLKEGETASLDDMMRAIVVHSANDASVAVAEYIAGSSEGFVRLMNQKAASLGMKDTRYYNVHGLPPGPGQSADVASAYDLALLARESVNYPQILQWSAIDTAPFRNGTFVLRNTNHLVRTYKGCDGLKTGFYEKAGFNVVATAKRGDMRLIAVVLGTPHKLTNFKEAAELMSDGFLNYEMHPIAKKGAEISQTVAVANGEALSLKPMWAADGAVFMKRGDSAKSLKVQYNLPASINAPVKAGQQIGSAEVTNGGRPVETIGLLAPADIAKKDSLMGRLLGKF
ncbi:MAG TPA: D-alanyl-D-alanine carboxypeptidase family protein, partial [Candidatus Binataceae bacterium]